jgi:hypothetical protein
MSVPNIQWLLDRDYLDICYGNPEDNAMTKALVTSLTPYQIIHWRNRLLTEGFTSSDDKGVVYFVVGSVAFCKNINKVLGDYVDMNRVITLLPNEVVNYSHYSHMAPLNLRLNKVGFMLPLGEIVNLGADVIKNLTGYECGVFFKCDYGLKSAESEFVTWDKLTQWLDYTEKHTGCSLNSLFWLFPYQPIDKEYRFAIVDGEVVSGSQYMDFNVSIMEPAISVDIPPGAKSVAVEISKQLCIKDDAYILDVALVSGEYRLIECNAISSSGWYAMDHDALCRSINEKVLSIAMELSL